MSKNTKKATAARKRASSTDSSSSDASHHEAKKPRVSIPAAADASQGGTEASTSSFTITARRSGITSEGVQSIKILNLNVCSILKAFGRREGRLAKLLEEQGPDIVVFTETHYDPQVPIKIKPDGMARLQRFLKRYQTTAFGVNPGTSSAAGVSIHSKVAPVKQIKSGLPTHPDPKGTKGRFLAFEYPAFHLIAVYVPQSQNSTRMEAIKRRKIWDAALNKFVKGLDATKPVVLVGDMNVAPTDDDVHASSAKRQMTQQPGCVLPHERQGWQALLTPQAGTDEKALVDVWKRLHPNDRKIYTHTSHNGTLNIHAGFRIDHYVVSERIADRVNACEILSEESELSDHIPITLDINLSLI